MASTALLARPKLQCGAVPQTNLLLYFRREISKMTENTLSSSASAGATVGPLESTAAALNAMVLQMALFTEMQQAEASGELTPELVIQCAIVFAATRESAIS